jgi:phosphoribosyl 1,2-cyclic phosphodiesterase
VEFGDQPIEADLLISHTHWDHIQGFPFFAPAYQPHNRIRIFEGGRGIPTIASALRGQMHSQHFPVSLDRMHGLIGIEQLKREPESIGPFFVRSTLLNHPGGCTGFRIETAYGSIAYIPDHEALQNEKSSLKEREALIEFLHGVDLLILDTQYTDEEYRRHVGWGHGCLPDSVALAIDARAGRLAFFHHDPSHRDYQIDLMVEAGRKLNPFTDLDIFAAAEMETIYLSSQTVEMSSAAMMFTSSEKVDHPDK